ncbi:MAG: flavodoxin family protein [Elusimicrobia bacterium]|nr:flavodoxin family protein [Elusimicrobiota bacterium]
MFQLYKNKNCSKLDSGSIYCKRQGEIKIKVIGISAGSSIKSRSELLLDSLLDEFAKFNYEISKIAVRDLNISFCDGLRGCEKTGVCKWKDDMKVLEEKLMSSDIVVVSSPIYFTSLPAKLKAIVDRCQVYWAKKNISGLSVKQESKYEPKPKKGFFISVAGRTPDFKHAEVIIKAFFSVFNIEFCSKFYLPNTDKISSKEFSKAMEDVKKISRLNGMEG